MCVCVWVGWVGVQHCAGVGVWGTWHCVGVGVLNKTIMVAYRGV